MPIKAQCGNCQAKFAVKDEWAGKKAKCPKCKAPMTIPGQPVRPKASAPPAQPSAKPANKPAVKPAAAGAAAVTTAPQHNPLLDLLQEAGVEGVPQGPICENCGAEMKPNAIICVECGFNMATGERLKTEVYDDPDSEIVDPGMTDAEKILAKAEQEIDEMPVASFGQNFGDGADAFVVAIFGFILFTLLVSIGLGVIYLMDLLGEKIDSAVISLWASVGLYLLCTVWITIIAFMAKPIHGIICVVTGGLYCIIFGFLQGRGLIIPTIMQVASILIGLVSYLIANAGNDEIGMLLESFRMIAG